jgi:hypothetical protein
MKKLITVLLLGLVSLAAPASTLLASAGNDASVTIADGGNGYGAGGG